MKKQQIIKGPRINVGGPAWSAAHQAMVLTLLLLLAACSTAREQVGQPHEQEREEAQEQREVSEKDRLESTTLLIDGFRQKMAGNISRAISLLQEAIEKDPGNDAAFYELAKLSVGSGELHNAKTYSQAALRLDPGNHEYHLLLADIYILEDDLPGAIAVYEHLAQNEPDNVEYHRKLASAYLHNEQYEHTLGVLRHMENISGFSREVSLQKQQILVRKERYNEAIEEAEKMIRFFPEDSMFYELLGDLYLETGQPEKARDTYRAILDFEPDSHMARLLLADYYNQTDEPDTAFLYIKEAFLLPGMDIEGKGRIIFSYLHWASAEPEYLSYAVELSRILLEVHPGEAEAHLIYGDILYQDEQYEKARDYYLRGARLDPSSFTVWQQILSLDLRLGDFEGMLEHSDLALEYFFEQALLFLFNGLANMQLADYEAAASSLEYGLMIAVADEDLRQDFLTMLGDTYHFLGHHENSDKYYQQALDLNADNATALNNYSYHLSLRRERLDDALQMSQRALELDPDNAAFLDTFGWIHYQKGNFKEAEKWIARSLEVAEEASSAVLEHYGDVLYQLGQKEEALAFWIKAKEAGEGSDLLDKKIRDRTLYE